MIYRIKIGKRPKFTTIGALKPDNKATFKKDLHHVKTKVVFQKLTD